MITTFFSRLYLTVFSSFWHGCWEIKCTSKCSSFSFFRKWEVAGWLLKYIVLRERKASEQSGSEVRVINLLVCWRSLPVLTVAQFKGSGIEHTFISVTGSTQVEATVFLSLFWWAAKVSLSLSWWQLCHIIIISSLRCTHQSIYCSSLESLWAG